MKYNEAEQREPDQVRKSIRGINRYLEKPTTMQSAEEREGKRQKMYLEIQSRKLMQLGAGCQNVAEKKRTAVNTGPWK